MNTMNAAQKKLSSLGRLGVGGCLLAVFLLLFWLPYHVPLARSASDSYTAGYNNRVATILVFLGALLAGWFLPEPAREARPGRPLQRSTLRKALLFILLLSSAVFFYLHRLDGFLESVYTVDRVQLMRIGQVPYRDFEFAYGPLLLYLPFWLLHVLPLSVPEACGLVWVGWCALGVLELYQIVSWTEVPRAAQRTVFLLLLLCSLPCLLSTGSSYALPRFLTPLFCAMALQRVLSRAPSGTQRATRLLLIVPFTAFALAISPEMGLAFAAGMSLYCLRYWIPRELPYTAAIAASAFLLGLLLLVAARWGLFSTLRAFSSGGMNFPLTPGPFLLLFLAALGITAAYVGARLRAREDTPLLASCAVAAGMLPAGLGRCDSAHLLLDGIGVLFCALLVCSAGRPRVRLLVLATFLLYGVWPFTLGLRPLVSTYSDPALILLTHRGSPQSDRWAEVLSSRLHGAVKGQQRLETVRTIRTTDQEDDLHQAFGTPPDTVFAAPFAFYGEHLGPYHSAQIDEGYYLGTVNLVSPEGVTRKVAELAAHPERPLLLPGKSVPVCIRPPGDEQAEIRGVTAYPYDLHPVHQDDVLEPLCAYIQAHYAERQPAGDVHFGYTVWVPRDLTLPSR